MRPLPVDLSTVTALVKGLYAEEYIFRYIIANLRFLYRQDLTITDRTDFKRTRV